MNKSTLVAVLSTRPIAYRPEFARICNSISAGVALSQLFYWSDRGANEWIYKTQAEWSAEIGITRHELDTVRRIFEKREFVRMKLAGSPPKIYYLIEFDNVLTALSDLTESGKSIRGNPANQVDGIRQIDLTESGKTSLHRLHTETTTENTTVVANDFKRVVTDIFEKGFLALTGNSLDFNGHGPKYGKAIKTLLQNGSFDEVRARAKILFERLRAKQYVKGQGFLPTTLLMNWNELAPINHGATFEPKKPFPNIEAMNENELRTKFTNWQDHFGFLTLKENLPKQVYLEWEVDGFYGPSLVEILVEAIK